MARPAAFPFLLAFGLTPPFTTGVWLADTVIPTDVTSIYTLLSQGGLLVGAVALIVILIREILVPRGRLLDEREQRIAAEKVRDVALEGWKAQAEATKDGTAANRETLQYLQSELPRRRA